MLGEQPGVGKRADTLVGGDARADAAADTRQVVDRRHRLLDQLEVEAFQPLDHRHGGVDVPAAVGIDAECHPGTDALAHLCDEVEVAGLTHLHLHGGEAPGPRDVGAPADQGIDRDLDVPWRGPTGLRRLLRRPPRRGEITRVAVEQGDLAPSGRTLQQRDRPAGDPQAVLGHDRHRPTPSSTASTSSTRAAPTSAVTRLGGSERVSTSRTGRAARRKAAAPSNAHGCAVPMTTTEANEPPKQAANNRRAVRSPTRTARVRLPACASVGTSWTLFASRIAHARRPTARPPHHAAPGTRSSWTYADPAVANEPEEHEDHDLAETEIAVRPGSPGVERTGRDRGGTNDEEPWVDDDREPRTDEARDRERDDSPAPHGRRSRQARGGEPQGAHAIVVGAAHAVGVVVRVVDTDLQRDRDRERGARVPDHDAIGFTDGRGRADEDRRDRGAEGARPCSGEPQPPTDPRRRCGHGRFGNRSNSGRRFSRYARLPSCASSLM